MPDSYYGAGAPWRACTVTGMQLAGREAVGARARERQSMARARVCLKRECAAQRGALSLSAGFRKFSGGRGRYCRDLILDYYSRAGVDGFWSVIRDESAVRPFFLRGNTRAVGWKLSERRGM